VSPGRCRWPPPRPTGRRKPRNTSRNTQLRPSLLTPCQTYPQRTKPCPLALFRAIHQLGGVARAAPRHQIGCAIEQAPSRASIGQAQSWPSRRLPRAARAQHRTARIARRASSSRGSSQPAGRRIWPSVTIHHSSRFVGGCSPAQAADLRIRHRLSFTTVAGTRCVSDGMGTRLKAATVSAVAFKRKGGGHQHGDRVSGRARPGHGQRSRDQDPARGRSPGQRRGLALARPTITERDSPAAELGSAPRVETPRTGLVHRHPCASHCFRLGLTRASQWPGPMLP